MTSPLVVVGDALLDRDLQGSVERMCPETPVPVVENLQARSRPGGAGLAAALAAARGRRVTLITALAGDAAGAELRSLLEGAGVEVVAVHLRGDTPIKTRVRSDGCTLIRLDEGGRAAYVDAPSREVLNALTAGAAVLASDYGRGMAAEPSIRRALGRRARSVPVVWDPHPRGPEPVPGCKLVTPNRAEAGLRFEAAPADVSRRARELTARWRADAVAVTMGARGVLMTPGERPPVMFPAPHVQVGDPCGAGDAFAVAAAGLLADGAGLAEAVEGAVMAASAFVGAGGAAGARLDREEHVVAQPKAADGMALAMRVAAETRARGGRVAATGGCFDLLHAGHVASLRAARALGDCLIVCLNSDASVRALKGADRPLVPEQDRVEVLSALSCVDAVVIFDEATPEAALRRIQPDVWAKGGDYVDTDLPEAELVRSWGGEAVLVPYLDGRSTTNIVEGVRLRVV